MDGDNIRQRLDRFCGNSAWCDIFGSYFIFNGSRDCSYHCPVLSCDRLPAPSNHLKRIFRFEPMWLSNENCEAVIKQA